MPAVFQTRMSAQTSSLYARFSIKKKKIKYRLLTRAAPWQLRCLLVSDISHKTRQGAANVSERYFRSKCVHYSLSISQPKHPSNSSYVKLYLSKLHDSLIYLN